MKPSMTDQQQRSECLWIVVAEWCNSSPTHHGPFDSISAANEWATRALMSIDACVGWEPVTLVPPHLAEHTAQAISRILDAAEVSS